MKRWLMFLKIYFHTFRMKKLEVRDYPYPWPIGCIRLNEIKVICCVYKNKKMVSVKKGQFGYNIFLFKNFYELTYSDINFFESIEGVSLYFSDKYKERQYNLMKSLYKKTLNKSQ